MNMGKILELKKSDFYKSYDFCKFFKGGPGRGARTQKEATKSENKNNRDSLEHKKPKPPFNWYRQLPLRRSVQLPPANHHATEMPHSQKQIRHMS